MTILDMKSMSIAEAKEIVENIDKEKEIISFLKKFTKLTGKEARDLRKEIQDLGLAKVKESNISEIINLLPEDSADINKIFSDVTLDENEINKLLEVVKKYK